jgi:hypothetical protein
LRRAHWSEQSFATEPYKAEIVEPAPDLADEAQQLRHAREQIALGNQYPGRQRSLPSGTRAIEFDTGKRSPKP